MSKMLHLTLKKKWFDMIASGEKKEEYRESKPYWVNRFIKPTCTISHEDYYPNEMINEVIKFGDFRGNVKYFGGVIQDFKTIKFTNGYGKNKPSIIVECNGIDFGFTKSEWSDNFKGQVFIIKLGSIIN